MNEFSYKNGTIYFWSGTGNSYRVSTWMGDIAKGKGIDTQVVSIDNGNIEKEIKHNEDSFIGIVFPTHGFTAPWHILKFTWNLPSGLGDAFCVSTRAGLKFGSVFTPGISGSAPFVTALLLKLKGYNVRGTMSVDMPSNWFSFHPIQNIESQKAIIDRAKDKTYSFMEKIISKEKVWFTLNNLYELIWGFFLFFISLGYLFIGRFFLAKLFFSNSRCDGCGVCAKCCSVDAIKMDGKGAPRPFWKYNCESCMRCAAFCPKNAIEAGHSWAVILYFIVSIPISVYLFSWFGVRDLENSWIGSIINLIYFYPAVFISYFIFHALIKIPAINWVFTHTTMTHFAFWKRYREPDIKLKDISAKNKEKEC